LLNDKTVSIFSSSSFVNRFDIASTVNIIALMMEAARNSETLVNFYQTTRSNSPEDSHLRTRRREKLKSYSYQGKVA
jgi:hypothetical protein